MVQRPEKSQEKSQDEHNRNNEFQQYNGWDVKKVCWKPKQKQARAQVIGNIRKIYM